MLNCFWLCAKPPAPSLPLFSASAIMAIAFLVAVSPVNATGIEDGFYIKSDDGSGQTVTNQDGEALQIGHKHPQPIIKATITSEDNANTRYEVRVTIPADGQTSRPLDVLAVAGNVYPRNGWGSGGPSAELMFPLSGAENAEAVAKYFGVPVMYRKHPGYNLAVAFVASKPEFVAGEEVTVTMRIQNVGSNAFSFQQGGRNRAARDNQYNFVARFGDKQVEDIGTTMNFGGLSSDRVVNPRETFTNTVVLNKWFAFDQPGTYHVMGSYYLAFKLLNELGSPVQPSWQPIWEDYATGEFNVKIVPAAPR